MTNKVFTSKNNSGGDLNSDILSRIESTGAFNMSQMN